MRKLVVMAFAFFACVMTYAQRINLPLVPGKVKTTGVGHPIGRSPVCPPVVCLEDNILYFESGHQEFTIVLVDESGESAYQVTVPENVDVVVLPTTLCGDYELRIFDDSEYYYYCEIEL